MRGFYEFTNDEAAHYFGYDTQAQVEAYSEWCFLQNCADDALKAWRRLAGR